MEIFSYEFHVLATGIVSNALHSFFLCYKENIKKPKNRAHNGIFRGSIVCFGFGFMVSELMNEMILKGKTEDEEGCGRKKAIVGKKN